MILWEQLHKHSLSSRSNWTCPMRTDQIVHQKTTENENRKQSQGSSLCHWQLTRLFTSKQQRLKTENSCRVPASVTRTDQTVYQQTTETESSHWVPASDTENRPDCLPAPQRLKTENSCRVPASVTENRPDCLPANNRDWKQKTVAGYQPLSLRTDQTVYQRTTETKNRKQLQGTSLCHWEPTRLFTSKQKRLKTGNSRRVPASVTENWPDCLPANKREWKQKTLAWYQPLSMRTDQTVAKTENRSFF